MNIDVPRYQVSDVAEAAGVAPSVVATWASRGLVDPYGTGRGRGRARLFTVRDVLWFALMRQLADLDIPLPSGRKVCQRVFGETFNMSQPGYVLVDQATSVLPGMTKVGRSAQQASSTPPVPETALIRFLRITDRPVHLIIDGLGIFRSVNEKLEAIEAKAKRQRASSEEP